MKCLLLATAAFAALTVAAHAGEITYEQYKKLNDGISYEATVKLVGRDGTEISSSRIAGFRTAMYNWTNDDNSAISLIFQNGRLISRTQFGLKMIQADKTMRTLTVERPNSGSYRLGDGEKEP